MGYSHYFTLGTKTTDVQKEKMVQFTKIAIELFGEDQIVNGMGEEGTQPEVTKEVISLNGKEDNSHETFQLRFNSGEWEFCKTNRKPYDIVVVACLMFADENNVIESWSSDGEEEDHEYGKALLERIIKSEPKLSQNKTIESN